MLARRRNIVLGPFKGRDSKALWAISLLTRAQPVIPSGEKPLIAAGVLSIAKKGLFVILVREDLTHTRPWRHLYRQDGERRCIEYWWMVHLAKYDI